MRIKSSSLKTATLVSLTAVMMAGCAKRDNIEVGAIPDDYRTRHPIVIAEENKQMVIPLGQAARDMTVAEKGSIGSFLQIYSDTGSGPISIAVPAQANNAAAAAHTAREVAQIAKKMGINAPIRHTAYQPDINQNNPPLIVSFSGMAAKAGPCGRWPEDILSTPDNKQYENFGCAYQNNLARQIANPMDLLGPRRIGQIDAANRDKVIGDYREGASEFEPNIQY